MTGRLLFLSLLCLYLTTGGGKGYSIDGAFGYEMAKTVFLDPDHEYFHRFKTAFARWGALMPLLGQPFVLAGDALARIAPERDALVVRGHTYRVEEWPALGVAGVLRHEAPLPEGAPLTVDAIGLVSFLSNSLGTDQGTIVGYVRLWSDERAVDLPVRAGVETAEWAYDRPDIAGKARHLRAPIAGHWIGQPRGNLYYADLTLPAPMRVTRWELLGERASALWHVRAAAFREAETGAWRSALTGERFWSERQTRDFFTRLAYSTLNAFTTAGTAVLVYALGGLFGYGERTRIVAALGYGLGTLAWPYAKLDFSEPASTFFVMLAIWALFRAFPPAPGTTLPPAGVHAAAFGALASASLFLAVAGKYTAILAAGAVFAQWALSSRWWQPAWRRSAVVFAATGVVPALALGGIAIAAMAIFAGETPVLFRNAAERLREDWLGLPLWIGLRGLLFSPGKSLFLYAPWLLLAIPGAVLFARRHGRHAALFTVFPAVVVLLYSMKLVWHGGGWGPRYLVPIVPLLALAAVPAVEWCLTRARAIRVALGMLAVAAVGVQLLAVAKDPEQYPSIVRAHVVPALPEMGSALGGRDYWLARGGDGLARALVDPVAGATRRGLGYVWGYPTADLWFHFAGERTVDLSLYFVDWDHQHRRQLVAVEDAAGRREWALDFDFSGGVWATWQVTGSPGRPVHVSLAQRGPDTAVVSATAFDAPRRASGGVPLLDHATRGDWPPRYGREGYVLFAWHSFNVDLARRPAYVARIDVKHVGDNPDPRIHVEIAEADLLDTPLLYALPFSPLLGNAWLLAADVARLVVPSRPDLVHGILLRPPWTSFGVAVPPIERPEFGLGLDFWPTLLYTNYASHGRLLAVAGIVLFALQAGLVASATLLIRRLAPGRPQLVLGSGAALVVALAVFSWLQVQA